MKAVISIGLLLITCSTFAQVKHDYNWIVGYDATSSTPEGEGTIIDFNNSPVAIDFLPLEINMGSTNTTICNEEGELLFYSNGCSIYNADHLLMENGDNINPGQVHDIQCDNGYTVSQGMISVPAPNSDNIYYIFHQHIIYETAPFDVKIDQLLYSTIDINANNGLGSVIEKNEIAIADTLWPGELTATKHSNGQDWWIMSPRFLQNKYYSLLLKPDSMEGPFEQAIGLTTTRSGEGSGQACFSSDGTKYARYNLTDQVYLFDFDRSVGQLSNFQQLMVADTANSGGVAFSPNSRFLYVSSTTHVYQFDLWAADIQASKKLIAIWDGFKELDFFPTNFYNMQMGSDCRIYINSTAGTSFMHVIQFPDLEGEVCQLEQRAIKLSSYNARTMPHFPNYRLGTTPTYPCDPSIDLPVAVSQVENSAIVFSLFPNPTTGQLNLQLPPNVKSITILNTLGVQIRQWSNRDFPQNWTISDLNLPDGLYYCIVETSTDKQSLSFVIIK